MGMNDNMATDKEGKVWENMSLFNHGRLALIGRMVKTDTGLKTIKEIRTYKYKAVTLKFTDGTEQNRDFDETFHVVPNTNEDRDD